MWKDILRWYVGALAGCLPGSIRNAFSSDGTSFVVEERIDRDPLDLDVIDAGRSGGDRITPLAGLLGATPRRMRRRARLRLDPSAGGILTREATLPIAVERHVEAAVAHEMDRLSPFDAEEVLWSACIVRRDRKAGTLRIGLALLPRRRIEPILRVMREAGLAPVAVEGASPLGPVTIPISSRPVGARAPERLIGAAASALAVACCVIPVARRELAIASVSGEWGAIAGDVSTAEALRRRIAVAGSEASAIVSERERSSWSLRALADLTRALPDGSYLTDLSLKTGIVTLDGVSPSAARLIAGLSADPAFANPAFAAPVTRAVGTEADLFEIRTTWRADDAPGGGG